jgi:hypothetical protein
LGQVLHALVTGDASVSFIGCLLCELAHWVLGLSCLWAGRTLTQEYI